MKPISRRRFIGTTSAGIAAAGTLSPKELRARQNARQDEAGASPAPHDLRSSQSQRGGAPTGSRGPVDPGRSLSRSPRSHRDENRLRSCPMRRVYGSLGGGTRLFVYVSRGVGRWPRAHHGGGTGTGRPAGPAAAVVYRSRRAAMRVLYFRPAHVGEGAPRRESESDAGRSSPGIDGQHLPLLQLQPIRGLGVAETLGGG